MQYDSPRQQRAQAEQPSNPPILARQSEPTSDMTAQMRLAATLDSSPAMHSQTQLRATLQHSPALLGQRRLAATLSHRPLQRAEMPDDDDDLLQTKSVHRPETVQRQPSNRTGLPDHLRAGMENLSGLAMDDVRVHYNSPEPRQLQALAFAQGSDIHVAPGQERHLPHEAWHVVQQRQGRVQPTMQAKGVAINDDETLESEADRMGERLSSFQSLAQLRSVRSPARTGNAIVQARIANPLAISGGTLTTQPQLLEWLFQQFGASTSKAMLARYLSGLEAQPTSYTDIGTVSQLINTRIQYDVLGPNKWREFIDAKDHDAALASVGTNNIKHPGEYYDFRRTQAQGPLTKVGNHFSAYMDADAFVSDRLNTRLTAEEYVHINTLASQGITSAMLKGVRTAEVTWSLPPNLGSKQQTALAEKGLDNLTPDQVTGGTTVHVPMPAEGIFKRVQDLLDRYYMAMDVASDSVTRFSAIIALYESLEALHAFKDGTSRTNHLVLNKLLAENGLDPAILNEPNSPTSSHEEFGRHVLEGIQQTRDVTKTVAKSGTPAAIDVLAQQRNKRDADELFAETAARKYGLQRDTPARPTFAAEDDKVVKPVSANLENLMGGTREHIQPLSKPSLLAPKLEKLSRLVLGNKRMDDYINYKKKQQQK
ncbi:MULTISPECIES: eCIS core domain-containing protein [unclassified Tardiphaga]|uniref:eCIS core domain-containing protein n=1 Tax=unclassified Tardiphaga TaxID=2631404 RepID=UPI00143D5944|nr:MULTISPECIES: DUF4157 domain-containing protein [unclassified Tardiphaga]